ncbi:smalltalk protein [Prevotella sp.]|nr:smalltalk protein [Prevotella sp.]
MKTSTWKTILQIAISILTALATTLGVTSCTA